MEKRLRMDRLFETYGRLLTDKRAEALRLSLDEDLSLAEIAEITGVSRQAVHDVLLRAEKQLVEFEQKLGFLRAKDELDRDIVEAIDRIDAGKPQEAMDMLQRLRDRR